MAKKREIERNFEVHTNPHPEPLVRDIPDVLRWATPEELAQEEKDVRALIALQKWRGKRIWKTRAFVFTAEDEQAFIDLLKETFPTIRFLDKGSLGARKHEAFGSVHTDREPELRYFDSLDAPSQRWFLCWVEPKGWHPRIGPTRFAPNARCILNEPSLQFEFRGASNALRMSYATGTTFRQKEKPLPPHWNRRAGELMAQPRVDDAKYKAFLGKAYNLVTKIATNKLVHVDTVTGRATGSPRPRGENVWVGHHALAWCREDPSHFLAKYYRPADEFEWRSKIPAEHPDYLTADEAHERFVARVRFEQQARELRQRRIAEANAMAMNKTPKKKPAKAKRPPKKKGG